MRRCLGILLAGTLMTTLAGCGSQEEKEAVKAQASIPVDGTGYLTVTINRKILAGEVQIAVADLPQGLVITDKEKVKALAREETTAQFTVQARGVEAGEYPGTIHVTVQGETRPEQARLKVRDYQIQGEGLLVMAASVTAVLLLCGYCIWRVLTLPSVEVEEHLKGPLEIDTRDTQDAD